MEENPLVSAISDSLPENVTEESLPPRADVTQESSSAAPAETPAQKVEPKEPPFNEHPRFKELIEERNYWRNVASKAVERPVIQQQQAPQAPSEDPYAGMSEEEKTFYRRLDERSSKIAEAKARQM